MAAPGAIRAGAAYVEAFLDKTKLQAGLKQLRAQIQNFGANLNRTGGTLIAGGAAIAGPIGLATKVFMDFDDAMRRVQARSSGTVEEMESLRFQAKELGRTTSFTAGQVGELQAVLAQRGFDRRQIQQMTDDVLALAKAAGSGDEGDAELSAGVISGGLQAFKLGADQAERLSNVYAAAVNNSNFTLEGLSDVQGKLGALADSFNIPVESMIAMAATMTNLNVQASESGTAIQSFLARMSNSKFTGTFNKDLEKATGKTVQFRDEMGNLRDPLTLLGEIEAATAGMGTAVKGDMLSALFGVRQFGKAVASMGNTMSGNELLEELRAPSKTAKETAEEMESGVGGAFRKLMSAVEGTGIAIAQAALPALLSLGQAIQGLAAGITKAAERNPEFIATLVKIGMAMLAAGAAAVVLGTAITALVTIVSSVVSLVGFFLNPVTLLTAAVIAIAAAFIDWKESMREFQEFVDKHLSAALATVQETIGGIIEAIKGGDLELAAEIGLVGLQLAFAQAFKNVHTAWLETLAGMQLTLVKWAGKIQKLMGKVMFPGLEAVINGAVGAQQAGAAIGIGAKMRADQKAFDDRIDRLREQLRALTEGARKLNAPQGTFADGLFGMAQEIAEQIGKQADAGAKVAARSVRGGGDASRGTFLAAAARALRGPQTKIEEQQLQVAKDHLKVSEEIQAALRTVSGGLTFK